MHEYQNIEISYHTHQGIQQTYITIGIPHASRELASYRIAVLTDFHYGCYTNPRVVHRAIELVQQHSPQLILSLGDYIHSGREEYKLALVKLLGLKKSKYREYRRSALTYAKELAHLLRSLNPKDGIISVWGNHDYIEGRWILESVLPSHIKHLTNDTHLITPDPKTKEKIIIYGIDDYRYGKPDLSILSHDPYQNDSSCIRILLSHNPDFVLLPHIELVKNFSMILSGHTHGGQVCLPGGSPIKTETRQRNYYSGFYKLRGSPFYIPNGIGCSGIPLRLNCPPEIVFLQFKETKPH